MRVPATGIIDRLFRIGRRSEMIVQFKRTDDAAKMDAYVGQAGELVIDEARNKLRRMDGKTPGGLVVANVIVDEQWAVRGFDVEEGK